MQFFDLFIVGAAANQTEVGLVKICCTRKLWSRNKHKWVSVEVVEHSVPN
jgi:hypothetical protein